MSNKGSQTLSSTTDQVFEQIVQSCSDAKGMNVIALDISQVSDVADRFVIVSGRSDRHVLGIANRILHDLEKYKVKPFSIEGYDKAHWVLLDFSDIIIHIFYQPVRELYNLESLWDEGKVIDINHFEEEKREAA